MVACLCGATSSVLAASADTTLAGMADVTGRTERGARFAFAGGRCGAYGYSEWRDVGGVPIAREELWYDSLRPEASWQRYRLQRLPLAQDVLAERDGRAIRIEIREGERRRQVRLDVDGQVLAGPTLITHLQSRLRDLQHGLSIDIRYLVVEQAMVLDLRAKQIAYGADGFINVRIDAASALLRPFVPTTVVTFDQAGQFVGMQGRLLPQNKRAVALDGVIKVSYPDEMKFASMKSICNKLPVS